MTIIHAEERALGPYFISSMRRLHDVEYDCYSVFIVAAYEALVGVSCIGLHGSVAFDGALGRLTCWQFEFSLGGEELASSVA
jgi:hypothetical protein